MSVVIVLILASLVVGLIFVGAFVWSVRSGQYEDTLTPALRVLAEDGAPKKSLTPTGSHPVPLPLAKTKPERINNR